MLSGNRFDLALKSLWKKVPSPRHDSVKKLRPSRYPDQCPRRAAGDDTRPSEQFAEGHLERRALDLGASVSSTRGRPPRAFIDDRPPFSSWRVPDRRCSSTNRRRHSRCTRLLFLVLGSGRARARWRIDALKRAGAAVRPRRSRDAGDWHGTPTRRRRDLDLVYDRSARRDGYRRPRPGRDRGRSPGRSRGAIPGASSRM